jgi:type VI secretion system protein ImpF
MASAPPSRLNPTLFDKLVGDSDLRGLRGEEVEQIEENRATMRYYSVPRLERFNESALRATVRRELAWLLNTINLESLVDLEDYPHVRTSVLNYGVRDLAGRIYTKRITNDRGRDIRDAIRAFEPRIDPKSVSVEPTNQERENAITYVINCDVRSAVRAMPVKFRTDIETDTSNVTVRD